MDDSSPIRRFGLGARAACTLALASCVACAGGAGVPTTGPPSAKAAVAVVEPAPEVPLAWDRAAYRARLAELPDRACRIGRSPGDAELARLDDGTVLLVTSGLELWRSVDGGATFAVDRLPVDSWWPGLETDGERVWIAAGEREPPRLVLLRSDDGGRSFEPPRSLWSSQRWILDPELLLLRDGALLLFATEVEGEANQQAGTYRIHGLRSEDGGTTWSEPTLVVEGPAGIQLEDLQAIELPNGEVLLAFEHEIADRGSSMLRQMRSLDRGETWSSPETVWSVASEELGEPAAVDIEPGGYLQRGDDLWLFASSDAGTPGASYAGARLERRISRDGGRTWSAPKVLVERADQLALSILELPQREAESLTESGGEVALLSLSFYDQPRFRSLFLYRLDADGSWRCGSKSAPSSQRP